MERLNAILAIVITLCHTSVVWPDGLARRQLADTRFGRVRGICPRRATKGGRVPDSRSPYRSPAAHQGGSDQIPGGAKRDAAALLVGRFGFSKRGASQPSC